MNKGENLFGRRGLFEESHMRVMSLILLGATAASCTTAPPEPTRSARGQQQLQELVAGKVAQPPVSCLPYYRSSSGDMTIIDDSTVAFRTGPGRVYVAHMLGSCNNLGGAGPYALVTRQSGSGQLCHGDIAEVVDTLAHVTVGSCAFGDFVPYVRPGA
jgi:Family of unknown function (DUF6491)